ncbi:hypothetical protein R5R51_02895 [Oenococcus oeni]|nr:hypothetical protein [Oenococcus oeni]QJU68330.1 hypothetical protein G4Z18_03235 [Oenococcus oeni]
MKKINKSFYKQWWFWLVLVALAVIALLTVFTMVKNSESYQAGKYRVYQTKITSVKSNSYYTWLLKGTTSAPNGSKIIVTPYSQSNLNYGFTAGESVAGASWAKVSNGKFSVVVDPIGITNSVDPKSGDKTKTSILAVTNYQKKWTSPEISKNILKKAGKFGYTTLVVNGAMSRYIKSLSSKKKTTSSSSSSSSTAASSSSSTEAFSSADYRSDITYDSLARNPDQYKGQKVVYTGEVVRVLEGDDETDLRVAINGDYDDIVYVAFDPSIMNGSHILENDKIQFYGKSKGDYTYKATSGTKITVPLVIAKKINDQGLLLMIMVNDMETLDFSRVLFCTYE